MNATIYLLHSLKRTENKNTGQQIVNSLHQYCEMRKPCNPYFFLLVAILNSSLLTAQGYQALHGSPYAGSTGTFNNPASPVNSAYRWDLTLFSTQVKMSSNSARLKNFSLANYDSSELTLKDGYGNRFMHINVDASLLNFLYKIDTKRAVTLNLRARSYNHMKTLPFNFIDSSVTSLNSFLIANRNTSFLEAFTTHTGWLEAGLNYSQVLSETNTSKLSGGITLQIMKGVSGAFMKINKLSYLEAKSSTDTSYTFTNGSGSWGYSDNYDGFITTKDFVKNSISRLGLSIGIEYLVYNPETNANTANNNLNYDWKIGVSILDIGGNSFKSSQYSSQLSDPNAAVTDAQIDTKLSGANDIRAFRDSLNTIFNSNALLSDRFTISNPTRLTVNIDKNLGNHFYVNGELNMNFYSTSSYSKLHTRELNLLTVTPRWETIGFGAYLPVQYNTQGQFWVGAALKIGPLVLGFHNLGLLKKDPSLNGGGYLLLSIHPFSKRKVFSTMDCRE